MNPNNPRLDADEFWRYFEDFTTLAWRWETQPTYTMPSEQQNVSNFLAGQPKPDNHNASWHDDIRAWAQRGKTLARVRVFSEPLTDYQRYQAGWTIPGNVAAGEDVRILAAPLAVNLGLPKYDFWIIDSKTVVHLNFEPDGRLIDRELITNPDLEHYLSWQQQAIYYSVPFSEWTQHRPGTADR